MFRVLTPLLLAGTLIATAQLVPQTAQEQSVTSKVRPGGNSDVPPVGEQRYTPREAVAFALADAKALATVYSPDKMYCVRYLTIYHIAKERRQAVYAKVTSFVVNSLNRKYPKIILPTLVEGSDDTVIRLDLTNYGIDPKVWDKFVDTGSGPLKSQLPEPYFHVDIETEVATFEEVEKYKTEKVKYTDGSEREEKVPYKEKVKKVASKKKERKAAPWLDAAQIDELNKLIYGDDYYGSGKYDYSYNPMIRADWFIALATIPPAYYDLLELGNKEADFEKAAFFDRKLSEKAQNEVKGAVVHSTVALHNRYLSRFPTVSSHLMGYYWESGDFNKSIDEADVVANILRSTPDAKEIIATLPNRLQFYFIVNAQGNRLDFADPQVAIDNETRHQDKLVYSGRNCMTCHSSGMRTIVDRVRGLAQDQIQLLVPYTRFSDAKELEAKFFTVDTEDAVRYDIASFKSAILAVNGLDSEANGKLFSEICYNYFDRFVTVEIAAAEVGLTKEEFIACLKKGLNLDQSIVSFLKEPPLTTRRDQWERRGFAQAMLVIQKNVGQGEKK